MNRMFDGAIIFNQDLSGWDVSIIINCLCVFNDTDAWTLHKPNFTNCTP